MASTKPVPGSGETRTGGTRVCHALLYLTVAMCAWLALACTAHAADASEFWPEANGFFGLGPSTRVYFNVEWFYGTRYDGWAGTLYQMGPEVTVTPHFRYEIYLARKDERVPSKDSLNALGFVAKWYY